MSDDLQDQVRAWAEQQDDDLPLTTAIRRLVDSAAVPVDRPAVDAGLAVFEAGGDFADGVIAFEGRRLGGQVFASFDRKAVELIAATGAETRLLSAE